MKLINKRHLFNPQSHNFLGLVGYNFAQSPQAIVLEDRVRVYFSSRVSDQEGMFISVIRFIDYSLDFEQVISYSTDEVITNGELGTFDEHGIFPFSPTVIDGKIFAYTCGWSRRVSVSVETSTGLVVSEDGGKTFKRMGKGPILSSSLYEPCLVGDSFVRKYNDTFHMWYMYGKYWKGATENEPPARVYKIGHATSTDGINWSKEEGIQILEDVLNKDECQALPTVIEKNGLYRMFFCYRYADDFRTNKERGYRLGYAESSNLQDWVRKDEEINFETTDDWDNSMRCYPNLVEVNDKVFLLYNGNEFGKKGFGVVEVVF
ncbi:MAG: hypothetical protein E6Q37_03035 [Crocinitomicaceae bacterium]|nr:MAG: hypothetical protein E6Q37_03035 [Crocinitomicaceae bacterium]